MAFAMKFGKWNSLKGFGFVCQIRSKQITLSLDIYFSVSHYTLFQYNNYIKDTLYEYVRLTFSAFSTLAEVVQSSFKK